MVGLPRVGCQVGILHAVVHCAGGVLFTHLPVFIFHLGSKFGLLATQHPGYQSAQMKRKIDQATATRAGCKKGSPKSKKVVKKR